MCVCVCVYACAPVCSCVGGPVFERECDSDTLK